MRSSTRGNCAADPALYAARVIDDAPGAYRLDIIGRQDVA